MVEPPLSEEDQEAFNNFYRGLDRLAVYDGPKQKRRKGKPLMDHYEKLCRLYRIRIHRDPEPAGDEWPTLQELQHFVGGYVEHVLCRVADQELHLFVNEDGRRLGLPANVFASGLYAGQFDPVKIRAALEKDVGVLDGLTIVGNAWLWIGPLPPEA